jgi:thiol-disulfide isomerase/thioredoxin
VRSKKTIIRFARPFFSSFGLSLLAPGMAFALNVGQAVPDFELRGEPTPVVTLAASKGKVIYLDFWASWCGPCRQSFPWMNDMQAKYAAKGLVIVAVNLDANAADAKKFLDENPAKFQLAFDPKGVSPKQFSVKGMPTSYLIDREGKLVLEHVGFNPSKKDELENAFKKLLDSK